MVDVSRADLIARLRYRYEPSNPLANADVAEVMAMAADALESVNREMLARELHHFEAEELLAAAELNVRRAEDQANNLAGDVAALESVTAPTELDSEAVERAAQAMFEDPLSSAEYSWAEMVVEDPTRADIWRDDARRVLNATAGVSS